MCGLTGIFDPLRTTPPDALRAAVERMASSLHHRGPDDGGHWVEPQAGLALGFRRLAIVDLSPMGHQPMQCDRGRFVLAFNGEIYNFEDLREELLTGGGNGRPFRGRSDTEVMLRAFEAWGVEEALKRFVGMFAFALWDRLDRTLWLARDRFGEKPLYYGWQGKLLVFGSELKSLRALPSFRAEIDRDALASFLRYGYVPAPASIYAGIRKLPPGTLLRLALNASPDSTPAPAPYWDARRAAESALTQPFPGSDDEAVDELDRLLRQVIRNQMIADVPLGAFLSGGTDSSTVVAIMQALSSRPVRTFTIGFQEDQYNEAEHARRVATHLGTEHTELYVTPVEAMDVIPRLPALYDEPFADASQIPTYLVSKLARQHVTVSLSGDGGDEFFAGYGWYFTAHRLWRKIGWAPRPLRAAVAGAMSAVPVGAWDAVLHTMQIAAPRGKRRDINGDKVHKFAHVLARGTSPEHTHRMLVSRWNGDTRVVRGASDCPPTFDQIRGGMPADVHPILRLMYADTMTYLPDNILAKVDRASMGVSLESRAPLLDHRVYEFAWRLPMAMKVRDGRGKWLLRQLLHRYVPRDIVDRPKMGFCVPIDVWLRGALRDWAGDLLSERRLRQDGYLEPAPVREKLAEHVGGARNWQHHLWNVLMFQSWLAAQ